MVLQRDWASEIELRAAWIRGLLHSAGAGGAVLGISGGKDSAAAAALLQRTGCALRFVYMPIHSLRQDGEHAALLCRCLGVELSILDLSAHFDGIVASYNAICPITEQAKANIKPRLRMTALYALAQSQNFLVAGTSNRSEAVMGYFTKWGDGASDFNPLADLTASEVFALCKALNIPAEIIQKAPSAGLFEGQTDEADLGVSYAAIDGYLSTGMGKRRDIQKIHDAYTRSAHKRHPPQVYSLPPALPED